VAGRVLAIVEGDSGATHHRAVAAPALAQRFAAEQRTQADIVLAGPQPLPPGQWGRCWTAPTAEPRALVEPVAALLRGDEYAVVAIGDTPYGRELAGRLAVRLDLPIAGSVLGLRDRNGAILAARPAAGSTRTATLPLQRTPALVVVNPDAGRAAQATTAQSPGESTPLEIAAFESDFTLLREERLGPWEMDVTDADVVVAGGRGVGGAEGFAMLGELATLLGGSIGASRVAVDSGWAPYARQVGLTGKSVSPRLYIACGISGAIHHTLGMRESSFVVAINSDAAAPIFKIANVAIVGDVKQVVPALISELRKRPSAAREALLSGAVA
jgi:electron transfer flavoprotein alpha subunit